MIVRLIRRAWGYLIFIFCKIPYLIFIRETKNTQTPISFGLWFTQNVIGINRGPYWPVHPSSKVVGWKNIKIGIETSPGMMPGCYIQGIGKIIIGDYTQIAANVGIISANHVLYDNSKHIESRVLIGRYCWIGLGAVILPGVTLGDYTIVGANSVVTKSFEEGYCVIAGNPAKIVKKIETELCVLHKSEYEYHGYIPAERFEDFCKQNLNF